MNLNNKELIKDNKIDVLVVSDSISYIEGELSLNNNGIEVPFELNNNGTNVRLEYPTSDKKSLV